MKMKTMRSSILCFVVLLLTAPLLLAQDLSKYRGFSIGTSLATVLQHTDQKPADVKVTHGRPLLLQELNWWPPSSPGTTSRSNSVEQVLFSFYNGELYKISVTYDHSSTEGLTAADLVKAISAKYGAATTADPDVTPTTNERYTLKQKPVASWEDSQYSFSLVRSSFTDRFGLIIFSKRVNAEAELAIAQAVKLEEQEGPQREAERQKKEADDLEVARQKNQKTFRP
jgi:hypothetical protein